MIAKRNNNYDKRLEKEINEYEDAIKIYKIMKNKLFELHQIIHDLGTEYKLVEEDEKEYQKLLMVKRDNLERAMPEFKKDLQKLEQEVSNIKLQIFEVHESYEAELNNVISKRFKRFNPQTSSNPLRGQPGNTGDMKRGYIRKEQYDVLRDNKQSIDKSPRDYNASDDFTQVYDTTKLMMKKITSIEKNIERLIVETNIT